MKASIISFAVGLGLLVASRMEGATNVVILGADFQAAINAASAGDTLVVQSGVYGGNLNFTKPLTIVCSGVQIQLTGTTTVSGAGATLFSQTQFQDTLHVQTNATVVISLSTCASSVTLSGGNMQAFDSQFAGVNAAGGKVTVKRCAFSSDINLNSTAFEGLRTTNAGNIYATAPAGSGTRFVMVQSYMHLLLVTGYNVWLAYNNFNWDGDITQFISCTDCNSVLVGNDLNESQLYSGALGAITSLRGTLKAYNNRIAIGDVANWDVASTSAIGIWLRNTAADIVNNTIYLAGSTEYHLSTVLRGINVTEGGGPTTIRGNIITISYGGGNGATDLDGIVQDAQQITSCSYCDFGPQVVAPFSGVTGVSTLSADPQMNGDLTLPPTSPCVHAGPPDAIYNNTDGTRNTIGATGGPLWNPANYTNDNPIVFWLSTSNQTVLKGLQSTIPVSVAASAGH